MNKIYIAIGVMFSVVFPFVAYASFDQSLSYGMASSNVLELQDFLVTQDCFNVSPTGFFGAITLQGVKCFQAKYGIIQTGYFGILSRAEANGLLQEMLAPSVKAEQDEASDTPSVSVSPSTQYVYISSQESITQPTMPQITVSGKIPSLVLSDIPSGVILNGFDFKYTSTDYSPQELAAITNGFVFSIGQGGQGKNVRQWNQYDISFYNLPTSNPTGKIKVELEGQDVTGAEVSGLPLDAAYILEIKKDQATNVVAYTISPAWQVEGRPNPNQ